jgi:hypothetical protein
MGATGETKFARASHDYVACMLVFFQHGTGKLWLSPWHSEFYLSLFLNPATRRYTGLHAVDLLCFRDASTQPTALHTSHHQPNSLM